MKFIDVCNSIIGKHIFHTWKKIDRNHRYCILCGLKEYAIQNCNFGYTWLEE